MPKDCNKPRGRSRLLTLRFLLGAAGRSVRFRPMRQTSALPPRNPNGADARQELRTDKSRSSYQAEIGRRDK